MEIKHSVFRIQHFKLLGILALVLIFTACGMQKRLYTKGFYSGKHQSVKTTKDLCVSDTLPVLTAVAQKKQNTPLIASVTQEKSQKNLIDFVYKPNTLPAEGCDTIFLRSGSKIIANISEVNLTKILFKNCDSQDESIVFIKKTDVSYIVYANGNKEVFETDNNVPSNLPSDRNYDQNYSSPRSPNTRSNSYDQSTTSHKLNAFALISFIMSAVPYPFILVIAAILGLGSLLTHSNAFSQIFSKSHFSVFFLLPLLLILAALLLSLLAIYQIKNSGDETKKGLKLAYIALILSILLLILLLAFIF